MPKRTSGLFLFYVYLLHISIAWLILLQVEMGSINSASMLLLEWFLLSQAWTEKPKTLTIYQLQSQMAAFHRWPLFAECGCSSLMQTTTTLFSVRPYIWQAFLRAFLPEVTSYRYTLMTWILAWTLKLSFLLLVVTLKHNFRYDVHSHSS